MSINNLKDPYFSVSLKQIMIRYNLDNETMTMKFMGILVRQKIKIM